MTRPRQPIWRSCVSYAPSSRIQREDPRNIAAGTFRIAEVTTDTVRSPATRLDESSVNATERLGWDWYAVPGDTFRQALRPERIYTVRLAFEFRLPSDLLFEHEHGPITSAYLYGWTLHPARCDLLRERVKDSGKLMFDCIAERVRGSGRESSLQLALQFIRSASDIRSAISEFAFIRSTVDSHETGSTDIRGQGLTEHAWPTFQEPVYPLDISFDDSRATHCSGPAGCAHLSNGKLSTPAMAWYGRRAAGYAAGAGARSGLQREGCPAAVHSLVGEGLTVEFNRPRTRQMHPREPVRVVHQESVPVGIQEESPRTASVHAKVHRQWQSDLLYNSSTDGSQEITSSALIWQRMLQAVQDDTDQFLSSPTLIAVVGRSKVTVRGADMQGIPLWKAGWMGGMPSTAGDVGGATALALPHDPTLVRRRGVCYQPTGSKASHAPAIGAAISLVGIEQC